MVTNGIGQVQRSRINRLGLDAYFGAIAISGELGTSKPGARIFDWTFEALRQPDKRHALMVGDSLSSDMRGGADYGIATCWYNPSGALEDRSLAVDYQIVALRDLLSLAADSA